MGLHGGSSPWAQPPLVNKARAFELPEGSLPTNELDQNVGAGLMSPEQRAGCSGSFLSWGLASCTIATSLLSTCGERLGSLWPEKSIQR